MTAALLALALAAGAEGYAIPSGREPLLLDMLDPPVQRAGCEGRRIEVQRDRVVAQIACAGRLQTLTLLPPGAAGAVRRTEKFSMIAGGPLPEALLDAVAASVGELEAHWTWMERRAESRAPEAPRASPRAPSHFPLEEAAATMAAVALGLFALVRGARSARRGARLAAPGSLHWVELAAFPAAFAALALLIPDPPAHLDTARDLLTARDLAAGRAVLPAVPASFGQVWHAALWIRTLQLWLWSGLPPRWLHAGILLGHVAAAALVWSGVRPLTSRGAALSAAAASLLASLYLTELPILWNPSLLPLPAAAFSWSLLWLARRGGVGASLMAAIALGACAQIHAVMLLLAPALLFAVALASRRPSLALLASAGGFLGAWTAGALDVVATLVPRVPIGAAALGALVSVGAGLALRRPFRALPEGMRAFALALASSLSCAAALTALGAWFGRALEPRYLAPLMSLAPISLALGARGLWSPAPLWMGTAWRLAVALALVGAALAMPGRWRHLDGWSLVDARELALRLSGDGWRAEDLVRHLRSPDAPRRLLGSILAFLPEPPLDAGRGHSRSCDLLAVKVPLEAIRSPPSEWEIAPLRGEQVAVLRCLPSALAWQEPTLCYFPAAAPEREACAPARFNFSSELLSHQAYPALMGGPGESWPEGGRVRVRALVSAAVVGSGQRVVETFATFPTWRVSRGEGEPPANAIALAPGEDVTLAFTAELDSASDFAMSPFPPDFVERDASEARLSELLARWRAKR